LWAKTFSALLIGTGDWYSTRCKLTWKLKGTKYNRLYFQLQASAIAPTNGTEFGLLPTEQQHLLKTPTAMDGEVTSGKKNPVSGNSGTLAQEIMSGYKPTMEKLGLLPTPNASDFIDKPTSKSWKEKGATNYTLGNPEIRGMLPTPRASEGGAFKDENGQMKPSGINAMAIMGLLPTPTTMDMLPPKTDKAWEKEMTETRPGRTMPSNLRDVPFRTGLLPTPKVGGKECYETRAKRQGHDKAISHLEAFVEYQMLPTPQAADGGKLGGNENQDSLTKRARLETGTTSQLSPHFVLELMGFPPNFTELPFLNGETNQSKPPETPLCPK
jgi:hypothetical protein